MVAGLCRGTQSKGFSKTAVEKIFLRTLAIEWWQFREGFYSELVRRASSTIIVFFLYHQIIGLALLKQKLSFKVCCIEPNAFEVVHNLKSFEVMWKKFYVIFFLDYVIAEKWIRHRPR